MLAAAFLGCQLSHATLCWQHKAIAASDLASYRIASAEAKSVKLLDRTLEYPEIHFRFPKRARNVKKNAENVLTAYFQRDVALELGGNPGTYRRVYKHPLDPNKIIKVYDPSMSSLPDAEFGALIQRELALEDFLVGLGFKVARINRDPKLLQYGIIEQERAPGTTIAMVNSQRRPPLSGPGMEAFAGKLQRLKPYEDVAQQTSGMLLVGFSDPFSRTRGLGSIQHGLIDRSGGNLMIEGNGEKEPVFVDW